MDDTTGAVRADIEATRARMSTAIKELERKVDVKQKVRDNPWPALAIAFGAGLALSASRADNRLRDAGAGATQKTMSTVGSALDEILATTVSGLAAAAQGRIDEALHDVINSIKGSSGGNTGREALAQVNGMGHPNSRTGLPVRAD